MTRKCKAGPKSLRGSRSFYGLVGKIERERGSDLVISYRMRLTRTIDFLERHARGRTILGALAASILFGVLPLSYAVARIRSHSPDAAPLDMSSGYTPDAAYAMIARYGDDVRAFYVVNAFTADLIGPTLFNLTLLLLGLFLLAKIAGQGSRWRSLVVLLPAVALGFDLIENVLLSIIISRFPQRLDGLVQVASLFTMIKRTAAMGSWAVTAALLVVWAVTAVKRKAI
jgi:hypothetical protein